MSPKTLALTVDGKEFSVHIASNSSVSNLDFDMSKKKLSFWVDGQSGTGGVTQVSVPKSMLDGELVVLVDGIIMTRNQTIIISDTDAETTLEINYPHSSHQVSITGTKAIPEFPTIILAMLPAVSLLVVFKRLAGRLAIKTR